MCDCTFYFSQVHLPRPLRAQSRDFAVSTLKFEDSTSPGSKRKRETLTTYDPRDAGNAPVDKGSDHGYESFSAIVRRLRAERTVFKNVSISLGSEVEQILPAKALGMATLTRRPNKSSAAFSEQLRDNRNEPSNFERAFVQDKVELTKQETIYADKIIAILSEEVGLEKTFLLENLDNLDAYIDPSLTESVRARIRKETGIELPTKDMAGGGWSAFGRALCSGLFHDEASNVVGFTNVRHVGLRLQSESIAEALTQQPEKARRLIAILAEESGLEEALIVENPDDIDGAVDSLLNIAVVARLNEELNVWLDTNHTLATGWSSLIRAIRRHWTRNSSTEDGHEAKDEEPKTEQQAEENDDGEGPDSQLQHRTEAAIIRALEREPQCASRVIHILSEELEVDQAAMITDLDDLDSWIDSLIALSILRRLDKEAGIKLPLRYVIIWGWTFLGKSCGMHPSGPLTSIAPFSELSN